MFGVSFGEVLLIALVALVVVGPRRLPEILGTLGQWIARLRRMTTQVRQQTGIDDILRTEGVSGGLSELRSIMRGDFVGVPRLGPGSGAVGPPPPGGAVVDTYGEAVEFDRWREHPVEGVDAYGAIPEDLGTSPPQPSATPAPPFTEANAAAPPEAALLVAAPPPGTEQG